MSDLPLNSSFSKDLPGLQIAWDSTSLGALKTCPRYYQYSIIEGWTGKDGEINPHLKFGLEFHAALELYDRKRVEGSDHDAALLSAVRQAIISTWNFELKRPWTSDEPTKTRDTLVRAIVWYLDQFKDDPLETIVLANGKPAVELSFRFDSGILAPTGDNYILCGHLDRLVRWQDRTWVVDRKTTKRSLSSDYFEQYSPDNQMSLYAIAGTMIYHDESIAGIIIDAGQTLVNSTRFQRGIINRTKSQLDEWYRDLEFWLRIAEGYATANYWPMNDKSCDRYRGCPFRAVCGSSPELRPNLLPQLFSRRVWDPLVSREV